MLAFVLSVALALQVQTLTPEALEHVKAGMTAQKSGDLKTAISEFKKVIQLQPDLAAAYVNLGAAYLQDRQYQQSIPPLKKSVDMNPDLVGAQQMLGYALLQEGYAAEAIPHLERAHVEDLLGIAELRVGRLSEAFSHLNAALAKRPNDPELLYYLGRASGLLSKEAMDTLDAAYPNSARSHQALGEAYAANRQVPEAEREYLTAIEIEPNARGVHLALGQLYVNASQWAKAEEQFRAEATLQPGDAETAYSLGNALLQQGKLKAALTELQRADRLRPDMPQTLYALGKAQSLSGDVSAAEKSWTKVALIEKETALAGQAHFALAGLYRKAGKTAQADREMQDYQRIQSASKK